MKIRQIHIILFFLLIIFAIIGMTGCSKKSKDSKAYQINIDSKIDSKIDKVLMGEMRLLETMLKDSAVIDDVVKSNSKKPLTKDEIARLDKKWSESKATDELVMQFMTNECAKWLEKFRRQHDEFAEIFITNKQGLNVCQTNMTSDYYQADEAWWTHVYADGVGHACYGSIEYDESSATVSIAIYLPVKDANNNVIGIAKAVVKIEDINKKL